MLRKKGEEEGWELKEKEEKKERKR